MAPNPKTLTITECNSLIEQSKIHNYSAPAAYKSLRNATMILCMLDAGMRVGEVIQAKVDWFMYDKTLLESVTIPAEFTKTKTERTIPIGVRLQSSLTLMSNYWKPNQLSAAIDFCFLNGVWGFPLSGRQIQRIVKKLGRKAGLKDIHPHMLRHTFGTRLMRTTNASIVQKLLGHKHLSSTQIYCHPNAEDLKDAINGIDKANGNAQT